MDTALSLNLRQEFKPRISHPDEVREIAFQGALAGCHEALFTLGEKPELRYPAAREWLDERGYESTIHYLYAMAQLVIDETGLLPHANAGAISKAELSLSLIHI